MVDTKNEMELLYGLALYYHLIRYGCPEKRVEFELARIILG